MQMTLPFPGEKFQSVIPYPVDARGVRSAARPPFVSRLFTGRSSGENERRRERIGARPIH